jgi:hypothetical protein
MALCSDPKLVGLSFDDWLKRAQEISEFEESRGAAVEKVYVESDRLLAFARSQGNHVIDERTIFDYATHRRSGLA